MSESKTVQAYLEQVAEQIRWKRARFAVVAELEQHLNDQKDAFAAQGKENAEQLAVEEMGDPVSVGLELDCIHRPKPQWKLLLLTVGLALSGSILRVWLTADWTAYYMNINPFRTGFAFLFGCVALLAGYFLDCSRLGRHVIKIYIGALILGLLLLKLSPTISGVSYYTRYTALIYPTIYALWVYANRGKGWAGLLLSMVGAIPLSAILILAPYTFGLLMFLFIGFVLMLAAAWNNWFGIGRWKSVLPPMLCAGAMVGAMLSYNESFVKRLALALHPEQDPLGAGYQSLSIRKALSVSQWLGEGTWSSDISPYPFAWTVPGCDSDGLLTTLIYKMGYLPFLLIVLVFMALAACLVHKCLKQKSQLGKAVAGTVVMTLLIQALFSLAWTMGYTLFPSSFPLIVGNLNTVVNMGLIGLALSVFRGESITQDIPCKEDLHPHYRIKVTIQKV